MLCSLKMSQHDRKPKFPLGQTINQTTSALRQIPVSCSAKNIRMKARNWTLVCTGVDITQADTASSQRRFRSAMSSHLIGKVVRFTSRGWRMHDLSLPCVSPDRTFHRIHNFLWTPPIQVGQPRLIMQLPNNNLIQRQFQPVDHKLDYLDIHVSLGPLFLVLPMCGLLPLCHLCPCPDMPLQLVPNFIPSLCSSLLAVYTQLARFLLQNVEHTSSCAKTPYI